METSDERREVAKFGEDGRPCKVLRFEGKHSLLHCNNCDAEFGYVLYSEDGDVSMDNKPKYCPCCGARVVSKDDN